MTKIKPVVKLSGTVDTSWAETFEKKGHFFFSLNSDFENNYSKMERRVKSYFRFTFLFPFLFFLFFCASHLEIFNYFIVKEKLFIFNAYKKGN